MNPAIFLTALILSLAFTGYAVASSMLGMTLPEFVAWGFRLS